MKKGECPSAFRSAVRRQEYIYFTKKNELETSLAQAEKECRRNRTLFGKKVISEEEYDKYFFQNQTQHQELYLKRGKAVYEYNEIKMKLADALSKQSQAKYAYLQKERVLAFYSCHPVSE